MAALATLAGLAPAYLEARWPHEREALEAIILEAREARHAEFDQLATKISNKVGEMLDKSFR